MQSSIGLKNFPLRFSFLTTKLNYTPSKRVSQPSKFGLTFAYASFNNLNQEARMKKFCSISKVLKNQKGQGVLEYVIISGLIGIFCLVAVGNFGKTIKNKIDQMDKKVSGRILIK